MSKAFNLSLIQTSAGPDKVNNLERTEELIRRAASEGANVICLQELFNTTYFCASVDQSNFDLAETIPGPSINQQAYSQIKNLRLQHLHGYYSQYYEVLILKKLYFNKDYT